MIDWYGVAVNGLWIMGCALALGTLSYASWQASLSQQKLRTRLESSGEQVSLLLAAFLVCAGLFGMAESLVARLLWAVLALAALAQLGWLLLRRRHIPGEQG